MSVRWIEGFEACQLNSNLGYFDADLGGDYMSVKYDQFPHTGAVLNAPGRIQGISCGLAPSAPITTPSLGGPYSTLIAGFGLKVDAGNGYFSFLRGWDEQVKLVWTVSGGSVDFSIEIDGVTEKTSAAVASVGEWMYVEIKTIFHATTGTVEVKFNTVVDADLAIDPGDAIITAPKGGPNAGRARWWHSSNSNAYLDDVYVLDGVGGSKTTYLGEKVVEAVLPDSNPLNNWTGSYTDINDDADDYSRGTYEETTAATTEERWGFANLATITGGVDAIAMMAMLRLDRGGYRDVEFLSHNGIASIVWDFKRVDSTIERHLVEVSDQNPHTVADWAVSEINSYTFGLKSD